MMRFSSELRGLTISSHNARCTYGHWLVVGESPSRPYAHPFPAIGGASDTDTDTDTDAALGSKALFSLSSRAPPTRIAPRFAPKNYIPCHCVACRQPTCQLSVHSKHLSFLLLVLSPSHRILGPSSLIVTIASRHASASLYLPASFIVHRSPHSASFPNIHPVLCFIFII